MALFCQTMATLMSIVLASPPPQHGNGQQGNGLNVGVAAVAWRGLWWRRHGEGGNRMERVATLAWIGRRHWHGEGGGLVALAWIGQRHWHGEGGGTGMEGGSMEVAVAAAWRWRQRQHGGSSSDSMVVVAAWRQQWQQHGSSSMEVVTAWQQQHGGGSGDSMVVAAACWEGVEEGLA